MIIAIDTGGTKTLVAAFEADGSLRERVKFPTPRDQTEYIDMVVREAQKLLSGDEPEAISVALPGVIREQVAVVCKNLNWHNFDVLAELKSYWPEVPMYLENDANLGAVGAAYLTEPLPHKLLYLTISTGVGGGGRGGHGCCGRGRRRSQPQPSILHAKKPPWPLPLYPPRASPRQP